MTLPTVKVEWAPDNDPLDTPGVGEWDDITSRLRGLQLRRGRPHTLDAYRAGELELILDNRDRAFEPLNAASPYYPNVRARKRIRYAVYHPDLDRPCIEFDGTTGDYAERTGITNFPTTAVTFECWLTGTGAAAGDNSDEVVIQFLNAALTLNQFVVYNLESLVVFVDNVAANTGVDVLGDRKNRAAPVHLAVTWRSADGLLRVYVDGALRFEGTHQAGASIPSTGTLRFSNPTATFALKGQLREVRIWNSARSHHAIRAGRYLPAMGYLNIAGGTEHASAPDDDLLSIRGDIDVRASMRMADYTPGAVQRPIINRWDSGQYHFWLGMGAVTADRLEFFWSPDGVAFPSMTATAAIPATDNTDVLVRFTLDVDDGGGNRVGKFFYKVPDSTRPLQDQLQEHTGWTQLGATITTAGTTNLRNTASLTRVGRDTGNAWQFVGRIYGAAVFDGIEGELVLAPDFTRVPVGATTFTEGYKAQQAGRTIEGTRTWTITGAIVADGLVSYWKMDEGTGTNVEDDAGANDLTITGATWATMVGRSVRFTGFIESVEPDWSDVADQDSTVRVRATDALAMLASFIPPPSAYRRTILEQTPYLYVPMDESVGSSLDLSGNGRHLTVFTPDIQRATDLEYPLGDTAKAVLFNPRQSARFATSSVANFERTQAFSGSFVFRYSGNPESLFAFLLDKRSGGAGWAVYLITQGIEFKLEDSGSGECQVQGWCVMSEGRVHHVAFTYDGSSSTSGVRIYIDGVAVPLRLLNNTLAASILSAGALSVGMAGADDDSGSISHFSLFDRVLTAQEVEDQFDAMMEPWGSQRSDVRVDAILDAIGWPEAERDLSRGAATIGPLAEPLGNALEHLHAMAALELGALYVDGDGRVVFDDRYASSFDVPLAWDFSHIRNPGDRTRASYQALRGTADEFDLGTEVHTQATPDGSEFTAKSSAGTTSYAPRVIALAGPWADDEQAKDVGALVLDRVDGDRLRFSQVAFPASPQAWEPILNAQMSRDRCRVTLVPAGGGTPLVRTATIEELLETWNDHVYAVSGTLAPDYGSRSDYFLLGASLLDGTARLP